MKVHELHYGNIRIVRLKPDLSDTFEVQVGANEEVLLLPAVGGGTMMTTRYRSWRVRGIDAKDKIALEEIIEGGIRPRLCWAVNVLPKGQPTRSVEVQVHEFPFRHHWDEPLELAVDEKIVEQLSRNQGIKSIKGAIDWLRSKLVIEGGIRGTTPRILISGGTGAKTDLAIRIHGSVDADVSRLEDGRMLVTRVIARPQRQNDRVISILEGEFRFVDYTVAARLNDTDKKILRNLVTGPDSYLSLWSEYNDLEWKQIIAEARNFGCLSYSTVRPHFDPSVGQYWRFHLDAMPIGFRRMFRGAEGEELEASLLPPPELQGAESDPAPVRSGRVPSFYGKLIRVDPLAQTLDVRPPSGRDEDIAPAATGVVYRCLSGDRRRIERRQAAQDAIASFECAMPQLPYLLHGRPVPVPRTTKLEPLSKKVRECFDGEPTDRQRKALSIALNTPDIALIQGPPGTGKTRTIWALQARLGDIFHYVDGVHGQILLTSYQHDAVDTVAAGTQVFGLPAVKVGNRAGQVDELDGFERWRLELVNKVEEDLAELQEMPGHALLRSVREQARAFLTSPGSDAVQLLQNIQKQARRQLPTDLDDRLQDLAQRLSLESRATTTGGMDRQLAMKAVRALRVEPASFQDDGPITAQKALLRLKPLHVLAPAEALLLGEAAQWLSDEVPEFLSDLRLLQAELLGRFCEDTTAPAPTVLPAVEQLVGQVLHALDIRIRESIAGPNSVLFDYLADLQNDPLGVRETVKRYTAVLAATCQQSASRAMADLKGENAGFHTVIVDEAARANPLDLLIPLSRARRKIVLVGDHRQLPHLLEPDLERDIQLSHGERAQEALRKSLFEKLFVELRNREITDGVCRTVTLDEQYRMHPVLGDFVSKTFYESHSPSERFRSGLDASHFGHSLEGYGDAVAAWVDIPRRKGPDVASGTSKLREVEAKWIAREAQRILLARPNFSVGVITFYSAQELKIRQSMETFGLTERADDGSYVVAGPWREIQRPDGKIRERLRIGTVDAFQGKEFDVVLLSMTRSNALKVLNEADARRKFGHLMLENRLCVAMSRQKRLLVVVGDAGMLDSESGRKAVPGLAAFYELCQGEFGVITVYA